MNDPFIDPADDPDDGMGIAALAITLLIISALAWLVWLAF